MATDIKTFLAQQVIARRKKAKLSQAALSKLTNLSIARISDIEQAKANPTLEALSGVLKVSVVDLLDYEGSLSDVNAIKEKITDGLGSFTEKQLQAVLTLVRVLRK